VREHRCFPSCYINEYNCGDYRLDRGHVPDEKAFLYRHEVYSFIYDYTHELIKTAGVKKYSVSPIKAKIIWADPAPVSTQQSAGQKLPVAHSCAVTLDKLALVREKGHIDHIHVDFWYDIHDRHGLLGTIEWGMRKLLPKLRDPR
jgi:hypothetical protein